MLEKKAPFVVWTNPSKRLRLVADPSYYTAVDRYNFVLEIKSKDALGNIIWVSSHEELSKCQSVLEQILTELVKELKK